MITEVLWSEEALNDLDAIFYDIATQNGDYETAASVERGIRKSAKSLFQFPNCRAIGRVSGTRELLSENKYYI